MIGDYLVVALVFGIAGAFVFIIHHFWLRDAFKEEVQQSVPVKSEDTCTVSTPKTAAERNSCGLSRMQVPSLSEEIAGARLTTNQLTSGATAGSQFMSDESRPIRLAVSRRTLCNTTNT